MNIFLQKKKVMNIPEKKNKNNEGVMNNLEIENLINIYSTRAMT